MKYSTALLLALAFSSTNALTLKSRLSNIEDTAADYGTEDLGSHGDLHDAVHEWMEDLPSKITDKIEEHVGSWGDFDLEDVDLEKLETVKDKLVEKLGDKLSSEKKSKLASVWSKVRAHFGEEDDVPATEETAVRRAKQSSLHGPPSTASLGPASSIVRRAKQSSLHGPPSTASLGPASGPASFESTVRAQQDGDDEDHHWTDKLDNVDWENFDWNEIPSAMRDHAEEHFGDVDWDNVDLQDVKDHIKDNMSSEMQSKAHSWFQNHFGDEGEHSHGSHSHGSHHWTDRLDNVDWENFDWNEIPSEMRDHAEEHFGDVDWDNVDLQDVKDHIKDNMSSEMKSKAHSWFQNHFGDEGEDSHGSHHWTDNLDDVDWENFDWEEVPSQIRDHAEEHWGDLGDMDWENVDLDDVKEHIKENMTSEMRSKAHSWFQNHHGDDTADTTEEVAAE